MTKRISIIGSSQSASTVPGWNDYELQEFERSFLTEGVIQGIGGGFAVSERGAGANMTVDVASGRAIIEITNTNLAHGETYKVYFDSDEIENVAITVADNTYERIDRVVLRIDVATDPDGTSANIAIIEVVEGTPSGTPAPPDTPANAISLATVSVPASDTSIEDAQITDTRQYVAFRYDVMRDVAKVLDLASTANGKGASTIGVEDAGGKFTGDDVEEVLSEIQGNIDVIDANQSHNYGDGSDGSYTLNGTQDTVAGLFTKIDSTNYRLDKDAQFDDLTISNGVSLNTNGYVLRVNGELDLQGGDNIISNGGDGGNGGNGGNATSGSAGSGGSAGTAGTVAHTGGSLPDSEDGKAGGAGGNGANSTGKGNPGASGSSGDSSDPTIGSNGANGGSGGRGGQGTNPSSNESYEGGSYGTGGTSSINNNDLFLNVLRLLRGTDDAQKDLQSPAGSGSGGGGSGGNSEDSSQDRGGGGGGGGGSGAPGGRIVIYARTIKGSGNIKAKGGNGGHGGSGGSKFGYAGDGGGGGGGGGGNGGEIDLFYATGSSWTGTATAPAGSAGSGGGAGGGSVFCEGGDSGGAGTAGNVRLYDI